jgi:rSAM/selenodomain-associated transferase 2
VTISVIIPVFHEYEIINRIINHLRAFGPTTEIIVVDGDPSGSSISVITAPDIIRFTSPKGRGNQLAAGVAIATGDILLMLHADTLLPNKAFQAIQAAVAQGASWGAFRLGIDATGVLYRIIEQTVVLRCKLFTLPYGDQAIFVTRSSLDSIGGIPAIPLMEDVELARRLHRAGYQFALLQQHVVTSPRRWQRDGIVKRTLFNWWLLLRYLAGSDPHKLMERYQ